MSTWKVEFIKISSSFLNGPFKMNNNCLFKEFEQNVHNSQQSKLICHCVSQWKPNLKNPPFSFVSIIYTITHLYNERSS